MWQERERERERWISITTSPKFLPKIQAAQNRGVPKRKIGIVALELPTL